MRTPTRLLTLLAAAGLTAVGCLSTASPAFAGASFPPPTDGYVNYQAGNAELTCSTDTTPTPVSITYSFNWDASQLHGSYGATVSLTLFKPSTDGELDQIGDPITVPFPVTPGASGTFTHSFALPADSAGNVYQLSANPTTGDTYYNYVANTAPINCTGPRPQQSAAPTATISPIACNGSFTLTLDGRDSTSPWGATLLFPPDSFIPDEQGVAAGKITTIDVPADNEQPIPTEVLLDLTTDTTGVGYTYQEANIAAFSLIPPASCTHHPTVSLNTSSVAPGGQATVTGSGFVASEHVTAVLHSTPLTLGTYTATTSGAVTFTFTVPSTFTPGTHTVTLTGASGLTASVTFTVTPSSATTSSSPTPTAKANGTATARGPVANTGTPTETLAAIAIGLLMAGGLALGCGSRKRRKPAHGLRA